MAKHGVLYEVDNFIPNCINRGVVSTLDIDGGSPVVISGINTTDKELYNVVAFTTGKTQVAIAYNPSVKYDEIGGKLFPNKSLDDRDYYNIKNRAFDAFIPEKNVEFGVVMENIDGDTKPTVGKFLEPKNGTTLFEIKSSQTSGVPSFEVVEIRKEKYPTFDFSEDEVEVYVVATRYNG